MFTAEPEAFQGRINSKFAREQFQPTTMVDSPSNQMKFEDIYPEEDNTAGGIFAGSTSSRARLFSQQRSLMSKKRQNQLQNEGMIRRSGNNSADEQYTPAIRQFSAPKTILSESTEFMKTNPMKSKSASVSEEERDFDDDDDHENRPNAVKKHAPTHKKPLYKIARPLSRAPYMDETKTSHDITSYEENEEAELGEGEASVIIDLYKEQKTPNKTPRSAQKKRKQQRRRQQQEGEGSTSQNPSADEGSITKEPRSARKKEKSLKSRKHQGGQSRERKSADESLNLSQEIISRPFVLDLSNMRQFLTLPIPKNAGTVQCYIRRNISGTNRLKPIYSLYLKDGDCFLMSSKKRSYNKTSNYLISMAEKDLKRGSDNYLGKLRSNFLGTEYQIFDDGINPKDSDNNDNSPITAAGNLSKIRCELGAITYAATFTTSAPRKMQVALPVIDDATGKVMKWQDNNGPNGEGDDLIQRISKRLFRDCYYYINKPPRWNEQIGGYVLNFHGRVTMASVKNFQLVQPDEQGNVILQFGKCEKDLFNMDIQYPMSLFQAFAIVLSSFDSKIACD